MAIVQTNIMKTKLTFLLSLTFLFLFSSVVFGDDYQDGVDAYKRKDYKTAYKLWLPLAEQELVNKNRKVSASKNVSLGFIGYFISSTPST